MKEIRMPKLGITMEEGKLVRWIKSKGDGVEEGEAILEIEAEKATVEEGLVVPVIRNADRLLLSQLAQKSQELLEKTQQGKLIPRDYDSL